MAQAIDAALSQPEPIESPEDAAEWLALEAEQQLYSGWWNGGVKHSNAPHPCSAYAHLPMRGITYGQDIYHGTTPVMKRRAIALWPDKKFRAVKVKSALPYGNVAVSPISKTTAHSQSAYSHLPLSGLGLEGSDPKRKWTLSASEKGELAARPLRHTLPAVDAAIARQAAA